MHGAGLQQSLLGSKEGLGLGRDTGGLSGSSACVGGGQVQRQTVARQHWEGSRGGTGAPQDSLQTLGNRKDSGLSPAPTWLTVRSRAD